MNSFQNSRKSRGSKQVLYLFLTQTGTLSKGFNATVGVKLIKRLGSHKRKNIHSLLSSVFSWILLLLKKNMFNLFLDIVHWLWISMIVSIIRTVVTDWMSQLHHEFFLKFLEARWIYATFFLNCPPRFSIQLKDIVLLQVWRS